MAFLVKNQIKKVFDEKRLYSYGIWLLSKRDYSVFEINEKFKKYQENQIIINIVIDKLLQQGYINDKKRALNIINGLIKKKGIKTIYQKLNDAGISKDLISEVLDELNISKESDEFINVAVNLLEKKFKEYTQENVKKYYQFLSYRGFDFDVVKKSIDRFKIAKNF